MMEECRRIGANDSFTLTLSIGMVIMGLNAVEVARVRSLMRKLRWLQLLKEFTCTVTSTWVDADRPGKMPYLACQAFPYSTSKLIMLWDVAIFNLRQKQNQGENLGSFFQ